MTRIPWLAGLGVVAALLIALVAAADEFTYVPDAQGKVAITVAKTVASVHRLPAADAPRFAAAMERIRDFVTSRPVLQDLRGVEINGFIRPNNEGVAATEPVPAFGFIQYYPIIVSPQTGKPVRFIVSTWEIEVGLNTPCRGLELHNLEVGPRLYIAPKRVGEIDGLPVYEVLNGSELIVVTRNGREPWVPVTREEYAAIWTAMWKKQAATMPPAGAAIMQQQIARIDASVRAMTPEQRRGQARTGSEMNPTDDVYGAPLVKAAPDWFDPALPRWAPQVISLKFDYSGDLDFEKPAATKNPAVLRVWQTLHQSKWSDLRSALAP